MLPRVLEPEVMDTAEDARDYDAMDHSAVNRLFAADFLVLWTGTSPVLDVGTGTAQIPIQICHQINSRTVSIVAIDLADHMLALARVNVARAGVGDRVALEKADAKRFAYPDGHFGAVISNSIIHHIPEPAACFAEMHRVCAPGGTLFVRDLLRPGDAGTLRKLVDTYAAGANDHQRKLFAESLHAALTLDEVRDLIGRLGYAPGTVRATSDRHWTWAGVRVA
jgi:ubiquinone/menaquinone biosynthesis C-methylase UbiE